MKSFLLIHFILLIGGVCFTQKNECPILPTPNVFQTKNTTLQFIGLNPEFPVNEEGLSTAFQRISQLYFNKNIITESGQKVSFQKLINVPQESYSIEIGSEIRIQYADFNGAIYAINSLFQLAKINQNGQIEIPACYISDAPRFAWRGLHLDVSRHFFTVDEVKKFIDLMAVYKFNTFHWHLTDDQGWRIEIKKYPKLTEIGAYRNRTVNNHYATTPRTWDSTRYGGYYTQDQIREVVKFAKERGVTVVPEIEMPGHARAALAAYPEYSCTGIQHDVEGLWGVFDDIFCAKSETISFLQEVLSEIIPLFPDKYFHIGGDEVPKTRWKQCSRCQSVIHENGLKDEHELQSYFIQKMDKFLLENGKQIIGWDEILEGGLSPNAAVMSWRGMEGGIEAAKQGHYVVMTPGSHCYFDHYQGRGHNEPLAIGGFTPLEKVYDFNPIPEKMNAQEAGYVLGAQGNLWTEYIGSFDKLMYMAYPRAIALSQTLWTSKKPEYDDFLYNLQESHFPRLKQWRVNYSVTAFAPILRTVRTEKGVDVQVVSKFKGREFIIETKSFKRGKKRGKSNGLVYNSKEIKGLKMNSHKALGAFIQFKTPPNTRYNAGDLVLLDGQLGARPWKGHEWLGFDTTVIEFDVILSKKTNVKFIEISFLKDEGSWIHLPETIEISTIDNDEKKTVKVTAEKMKVNWKVNNTQKIHLKIQALKTIPNGLPGEGHAPWTFIDEIIVK